MSKIKIERERIDKVKQHLKNLVQHPEDVTYKDYLNTKLIRAEVGTKLIPVGLIVGLSILAVDVVGALLSDIFVDPYSYLDVIIRTIGLSMGGVGLGAFIGLPLTGLALGGDFPQSLDELAYVQAVKELKKEKDFDFKKLKSIFKQYKKSDKFVEDKKQYDTEETKDYYWTKITHSGSGMVREMLAKRRDKKLDQIDKKAQKELDKRAGVKPVKAVKKSKAKIENAESDNNLTF